MHGSPVSQGGLTLQWNAERERHRAKHWAPRSYAACLASYPAMPRRPDESLAEDGDEAPQLLLATITKQHLPGEGALPRGGDPL